jgi:hypothetical protein
MFDIEIKKFLSKMSVVQWRSVGRAAAGAIDKGDDFGGA